MHAQRKVLRPLAAALIATAIAVPAFAQSQGLSPTGPGTAAAARVTTAHRDRDEHRPDHTPSDAAAPGRQHVPRHRGRTGAQPAATARRRHCDARVLRHASARTQEGRHRRAVEPHRQPERIAGCARPAARRHHDPRDRDRCRRHRYRRGDPDHFSAWPGRPDRNSATQGSGAIQADRRGRSSGGYVRGSRRAFHHTGVNAGNGARRHSVAQVDDRRPRARCLSECQFLGFGHRRRPVNGPASSTARTFSRRTLRSRAALPGPSRTSPSTARASALSR